jgi:hypothetical protein
MNGHMNGQRNKETNKQTNKQTKEWMNDFSDLTTSDNFDGPSVNHL